MRQWKREVEQFSKEYHFITIDARGHGKSSLPKGKVPHDAFWQDVVAVMNHLDIPKAVICGLSMGSHVALQVAINAGERVKRSHFDRGSVHESIQSVRAFGVALQPVLSAANANELDRMEYSCSNG